MKQSKKEGNHNHSHGAEWSNCPRCGEKISLVKKRENAKGERPTIVVIDDELGIRDLLETAFEGEGYQVSTAERAEEGLELVRTSNPNLVFLDIRLPDKNGVDVLKEIKAMGKDTSVIMITAYGDSKEAVRCMGLGAAAYVTKPFDVQYVSMLAQNQLT